MLLIQSKATLTLGSIHSQNIGNYCYDCLININKQPNISALEGKGQKVSLLCLIRTSRFFSHSFRFFSSQARVCIYLYDLNVSHDSYILYSYLLFFPITFILFSAHRQRSLPLKQLFVYPNSYLLQSQPLERCVKLRPPFLDSPSTNLKNSSIPHDHDRRNPKRWA